MVTDTCEPVTKPPTSEIYFSDCHPQASHSQPLIRRLGIVSFYQSIMALSHPSQEVAEKSLLERGFYCWEDISAGNRVSELEKRGFPYFTEYGLDFCADFAFDPVSLADHSTSRC